MIGSNSDIRTVIRMHIIGFVTTSQDLFVRPKKW